MNVTEFNISVLSMLNTTNEHYGEQRSAALEPETDAGQLALLFPGGPSPGCGGVGGSRSIQVYILTPL